MKITRRTRSFGFGWTSSVEDRAGSLAIREPSVTETGLSVREVCERVEQARRANSGHDWRWVITIGGRRIGRNDWEWADLQQLAAGEIDEIALFRAVEADGHGH